MLLTPWLQLCLKETESMWRAQVSWSNPPRAAPTTDPLLVCLTSSESSILEANEIFLVELTWQCDRQQPLPGHRATIRGRCRVGAEKQHQTCLFFLGLLTDLDQNWSEWSGDKKTDRKGRKTNKKKNHIWTGALGGSENRTEQVNKEKKKTRVHTLLCRVSLH